MLGKAAAFPKASPVQCPSMTPESPQEAPLPDRNPVHARTPRGAGALVMSPPAEAVPAPAEPPKGAPEGQDHEHKKMEAH